MSRMEISGNTPAESAERLSDAGDMSDAHMEAALDDVIDIILLYGVYPMPSQKWMNGGFVPHNRVTRFDLQEWVLENIDPVQLAESYVDFICSMGLDGEDRRDRQYKTVEKMLRDFLTDSDIVREKAEEIAEEAEYELFEKE